MLASSAVLGAILSCRGPASSSFDASPPEVAIEFCGVPATSASATGASVRDGGSDLPDATFHPCALKGWDAATAHALKVRLQAKLDGGMAADEDIQMLAHLDPPSVQPLAIQLEAKVNAGTATDRDIKMLTWLCLCLEDRPCVEWANVVDSQGWRALDGAVVKIDR
jgi:hypothetical protein